MLRHRLALPWLWAHRARRLFAPSPPGLRILLFHHVREEQFPVLERLVDTVKRARPVLSPGEAADWLSGTASPAGEGDGPCLFSFDDGFVSNHRAAIEVLEPQGVKGLFFVCPGLMDLSGENQRSAVARNIFDGRIKPADIPPHQRLMTWDEVRELDAKGHAIGAHGMTHRRLSRLSGEDLKREISVAGERLNEELSPRSGQRIQWYAYAFGDVASITAAAMEIIAANYDFCRSGVRGSNGPGIAAHGLRGDNMDLDGPGAYRRLILEGGLDSRYAQARDRLDQMADPSGREASSSSTDAV